MEKIAIIAGAGELPYYFLQAALEHHEVHILSLFQECDPRLKEHEHFFQVSFHDIPNAMTYLMFQQIQKVVMLGKVEKQYIFNEQSAQSEALELISGLKDKKDETIVLEIINFLKLAGIEVMPQSYLLSFLIAQNRCYTTTEPTAFDDETIRLGIEASRLLTGLDIGQTVVCKDRSVVAVQGIEGTDKTIQRAGEYAGKETIIVKSARPNQDDRIDIPTVGLHTIQQAIAIEAKGIVIQAEKMFFLDQEASIELANQHHLFIVGV